MLVVGANPAANLPGAADVLGELELLATIEPFPSETARLADYILPPALAFERPDFTRPYEAYFTVPFAQYTEALLPKPAGVLEDWEILWELAATMGLTLRVGGLNDRAGRRAADLARRCSTASAPAAASRSPTSAGTRTARSSTSTRSSWGRPASTRAASTCSRTTSPPSFARPAPSSRAGRAAPASCGASSAR